MVFRFGVTNNKYHVSVVMNIYYAPYSARAIARLAHLSTMYSNHNSGITFADFPPIGLPPQGPPPASTPQEERLPAAPLPTVEEDARKAAVKRG